MNQCETIRYLRQGEIDIERWDNCICNSINSLPYAFSWYLDRIAVTWDALVMGDYLYVMPLPTGRKVGIRYLMQPLFMQQLGIFSPSGTSTELVNLFLEAIPGKFRYINLNLNSLNYPVSVPFSLKENTNYQLDLSLDYSDLCSGYSENTKRNLKLSGKNGLQVVEVHNPNAFTDFVKESFSKKVTGIQERHYSGIRALINFTALHHSGRILGVYSQNNSLCAAAFFLNSAGKHFYLLAASNQEGAELRAMFLLVDHYIKARAGKQEILDFEGSNRAGIARFFAGFGAVPAKYQTIMRNRLPWPINLLKK